MDTTNQNAGGAQRHNDAALYWHACAALRGGHLTAGLAPMLRLAWASSPVLRARVRAVLTGYGVTVSDDAAPTNR